MSAPPFFEARYVPDAEIRRLFNDGPYRQMIAEGRLTPQYLRNAHLTAPEKGNPPCTQRQMIRYLDAEKDPIVEVFQYLRPDQSLGATGMPDPKRLWYGGAVLIAESQQPRS